MRNYFSKKCRMRGVRAGLGVLAPYGPTLGPIDQGKPLNFMAEFKWTLHVTKELLKKNIIKL